MRARSHSGIGEPAVKRTDLYVPTPAWELGISIRVAQRHSVRVPSGRPACVLTAPLLRRRLAR